ncbi:MAG: outer membrane lipoprotein-sorting protein [Myxococcota bacterium]|jgi:outer membrane lipoprotein-sorting protein
MRHLFTALLLAWSTAAFAEDPTVEQLLSGTDDLTRGTSSQAIMVMEVKTARYERTVKMQSWSQGTDKSLIQILEPAKEAGISTLKVGDNIWNYLPKVDRTMKVPAGMMSGAWMGSHISNDDLVKESRLSEDFDYEITERPEGDTGRWVIELTPRPDAAIVWGKIVATIGVDQLPQTISYHDEDGALVRTMTYSDIRDIGGRLIPTRFTVVPADKPGEYTAISYESLEFDVEIPDSTFSLQALRR